MFVFGVGILVKGSLVNPSLRLILDHSLVGESVPCSMSFGGLRFLRKSGSLFGKFCLVV